MDQNQKPGQAPAQQAPQQPTNPTSTNTAPLPQGHAAGAPQPAPVPQTGTPKPDSNTQVAAAPQPVTQAPVAPSGGGGKMKIIIIVIILLIIISLVAVVAIFFLSPSEEQKTIVDQQAEEAGPREHQAEEFPDFVGVELTEDTVAFNKVDESYRIRYKGQIFHEQDSEEFTPREVFPEEEALVFDWYGLVQKPEEAIDDGKLHSFKAPETYQSFMFIMRWDDQDGERYYMYRFKDNQISLLREFTKDRLFYVPIIDGFSLGGNFASIKLFTCPTCFDENPELLLYEISTGNVKNLGQVSYFAWGDDDKSYEYREYKEGVDESEIPIRRNEFFSQSVDILDP